MEYLIEKFRKKIAFTETTFQRSLLQEIHWEARLIGIRGARGSGKTTLLLQYIKLHLSDLNTVLYVSMDDLWFSNNRLVSLARQFSQQGGRYLFLDEVHKYPNWSQEIKNIYDDFPNLKVVFTGSSLLEILNARADLSRRAITYHLAGLSFREYLNFVLDKEMPVYSLADILDQQTAIATRILSQIQPLAHFSNYLSSGYYPYFKEIPALYPERLLEVINLILEIELPLLRGVDIQLTPKLKQLLLVISESAPFTPNISSLSSKIGINRNTLLSYLHHLQEAGLTRHLYKDAKGITRMQKPDKIFLENTNIAFAVNAQRPEMGTLRETFFANQLSYAHEITYPKTGDFVVDQQFLFEVGGPNKSSKQLPKNTELKTYLAVDQIEFGHQNRIPLWLFGFLY